MVKSAKNLPKCKLKKDCKYYTLSLVYIIYIMKESVFMNKREEFLNGLFDIVQRNGDKVAIKDSDNILTYNELNMKANLWANYLHFIIGTDSGVIGVELERSADWVVSILAIFKAGYTYCPIDKNAPIERKEFMLNKANAVGLISDNDEVIGTIQRINLKMLNFQKVCEKNNESNYLCKDDVAYIIYTSGTTGKPKGVQINYSGMLNHLKYKIDFLNLSSETRLIQLASQCFDISIWQVLAPLLVGGEVHIISKNNMSDLRSIAQYIKYNRINIMEIVPSYFTQIVNGRKEILDSIDTVKYILLTGERLPVQLCKKWYELTSYSTLINAYGPTECSDDITHYVICRDYNFCDSSIPIGYAIDNAELKVIEDSSFSYEIEEVDFYEKGELVVSGECLGNGYVNDDEMTAKHFVFDRTGKRYYKTGDLVSKDEKGCFFFWGRIDRQVKIKGYRIETQEIEELIREIQGVRDCYVTVKEKIYNHVYFLENQDNSLDTYSKKILVAYIVLNVNKTKEMVNDSIEGVLKKNLPEYMIPDDFVYLDHMPLTLNGKVDEEKLPIPEVRHANENFYVKPTTQTEIDVAKIWEKCLSVSPIGLDDNFADWGDSLSYMVMISKIEDELNLSIDYSDITKCKNLKEFCDKLYPISKKRISRCLNMDRVRTSFAEKGQYFLWKMNPNSIYYSFQGKISISGNIDINRLSIVIDKIIKEHQILRCNYYFNNQTKEIEKRIRDYRSGNLVCYDFSDLEENEKNKNINDLVSKIGKNPFDLENDNLFLTHLFKVSSNKYILLCTTHEVIMDAWSIYKFIDEIQKLYYMDDKLYLGYGNLLQYHDFADWEYKEYHTDIVEAYKRYWNEQLSGDLPILNLSLSDTRDDYLTNNSNNVLRKLDTIEFDKIKKFNRKCGVTLFQTLMSTYFLTLYMYSGQNDIIIGTPYASRDMKEKENLYGCFINMLPIRQKINDDMDVLTLITSVSDSIIAAISNSKYPFINMVEDKKFERLTNVTPIFQVMFDMVNFPILDYQNKNMIMNFQEVDLHVKKYDLNLYAFEQNNELILRLSYLTDLFSEQSASKIVDTYMEILDCLIDSSEIKIQELKKLLFSSSNNNNDKINQSIICNGTIPLWNNFFDNTTIDSNAIIYRDGNDSIDYYNFKKEVNKTATYFESIGIKKENVVMILADKDIRTIINIVSLLKIGVTYVPVDLFYSSIQIDELIDNLGINWVISDKEIGYICKDVWQKKYIYKLSEEKHEFSEIACIIATSASSGKQKYVKISRDSFINRVYNTNNLDVNISNIKSMISLRSVAIVTHIFELFTNLVHGNCNYLLNRTETLVPSTIVTYIEGEKIEYIVLAPSLLKSIISEYQRNNKVNKSIKTIISGSAKLDLKTINDFYDIFSNGNLYNSYGTTETSSTCYFQKLDRCGSVVMGETICGSKIHIVDSNMNEMISGVPGEIVIEGDCVSDGYCNLDIHNFDFCNNKKMYHTGDIGMIDSNGFLQIKGRNDKIVKCRGYKIDFNEIEIYCKKMEGISDVVCILEKETEESYALFFVKNKESEVNQEILYQFLKTKFPLYMLPQYIIEVDELPKTLSGKVKYSGLAQLFNEYCRKKEFEELTCTEKIVLAAFKKILRIENILKNDNFFMIGGNSLLAVELVLELSEKGKFLMVADVYDGNSSVKEIAQIIDGEKE